MFKFIKTLFKGKKGGTLVGNLIRGYAYYLSRGLIGKNPIEIAKNYIDGESRVEYPRWLDRNGNGSIWN